jgi:hypothetical protein
MRRFNLRPLNELDRRRLLTWSAVLCAIPICLAPLAGRSSFELAGEQAAFDERFRTPAPDPVWNDKPVAVARDPFVPEGAPVSAPGIVSLDLPANFGAGASVRDVSQIPAVTGVVIGSSPRALIDDGTHVRVVAIGDLLAGFRIVAIDGAGVHLQNNVLIPLARNAP